MPRHPHRLLPLLLIALLFSGLAHAGLFDRLGGGSAPLPVAEAFPFSAQMTGERAIQARFDTRKGYYLYRDKLAFELRGQSARVVGTEIGRGEAREDATFGRVEVLAEPVTIRLMLDRPLAGEATLAVAYQGCAEIGLCYPPSTLDYPLIPVSAGGVEAYAPVVTPSGVPGVGIEERLTGMLSGYLGAGSPWLALGLALGLGVVVAFMGCLYPMIPILSGLIAGDRRAGGGLRATWLAFVYVEASAVVYAIAGALAALGGRAIQGVLQGPWAIGGFAGLLTLMALGMFGVFSLQLPGAWQSRLDGLSRRQRGGSVLGVAIMGALSSLIIGACAGPAVVALLSYVATTRDVFFGGLLLFVFANGLGLPLIVAGTALGRWLPRAGHWMAGVRRACGVAFLAAAILLLGRILPSHLTLLLWGVLCLGCAVYLGAFDPLVAEAGLRPRARKFAGVVLLIWGAALLLGAASGGTSFWRPLARVATAAEPLGTPFQPVRSVAELDEALARARASGRAALLDVYADWCSYCVRLERETFPDPGVRAALADALLLRVDVTAMTAGDKALLARLGVFLPPAVMFYGADGAERRAHRVVGFLAPADFAARARVALAPGAGP